MAVVLQPPGSSEYSLNIDAELNMVNVPLDVMDLSDQPSLLPQLDVFNSHEPNLVDVPPDVTDSSEEPGPLPLLLGPGHGDLGTEESEENPFSSSSCPADAPLVNNADDVCSIPQRLSLLRLDAGNAPDVLEEKRSEIQISYQQLLICFRKGEEELRSEYNKVDKTLLALSLISNDPINLYDKSTISKLRRFRGGIARAASSIDQFMEVHRQFVDKISQLRSQMSSTSCPDPQLFTQIQNCDEILTEIETMLQPDYNLSILTHTSTNHMTAAETISYRGLLSYLPVILDKLAKCGTCFEGS